MIKVKINKENNIINNITIKGHSLYDDYGKDIVCASVSSIVITTVNGILNIYDNSLSYEENNGYLSINILIHNDIIDKLINNMIDLLKSLEKDYKNNIKIQ